jgi:hypothetical protein
MSTKFKTVIDDMKTSLKLAKNNVLTYVLANLGMVLLVALLFLLIAIPIGLIVAAIYLTAGPSPLMAWVEAITGMLQSDPLAIGIGAIILIAVPVVSLFLVAVGSIYGISKEIVENGSSRAESAFSWFRRKFLTFAGAGFLLTVIVLLPVAVLWYAVNASFGFTTLPLWITQVLSAITFVWVFITIGLTFMVFPAVTQGKGVQAAFKESFKLATSRFDRVFGLWTGIVLLAVLMFSPLLLWGTYIAVVGPYTILDPISALVRDPITAVVSAWSIIAVLLWSLLLYPMAIIASCKVHAELTGARVYQQPKAEVPIV